MHTAGINPDSYGRIDERAEKVMLVRNISFRWWLLVYYMRLIEFISNRHFLLFPLCMQYLGFVLVYNVSRSRRFRG